MTSGFMYGLSLHLEPLGQYSPKLLLRIQKPKYGALRVSTFQDSYMAVSINWGFFSLSPYKSPTVLRSIL